MLTGGYLATTPPANDVAHARRGGQPSCLEVNIRGRGERGETAYVGSRRQPPFRTRIPPSVRAGLASA
jgi:hypothetical protein